MKDKPHTQSATKLMHKTTLAVAATICRETTGKMGSGWNGT